MKIIFCDNSLKELINFREDVIKYYADKGIEVILIAPKNVKLTFNHPYINHVDINMKRSSMNPTSDIIYLWTLFRIYRKEKPDYIFHYTIKPNIYGSLAARLLKIPSTAMIAGLGYVFGANGFKARVGRWLYKYTMKFPEHILVLNKYNYDLIKERKIASESKLILLKGGEGVNLNKFE